MHVLEKETLPKLFPTFDALMKLLPSVAAAAAATAANSASSTGTVATDNATLAAVPAPAPAPPPPAASSVLTLPASVQLPADLNWVCVPSWEVARPVLYAAESYAPP